MKAAVITAAVKKTGKCLTILNNLPGGHKKTG
jgi:hypothetical protein